MDIQQQHVMKVKTYLLGHRRVWLSEGTSVLRGKKWLSI